MTPRIAKASFYCFLAICIEKAIFSSYNSSWLFPFFKLLKKFRINVLCPFLGIKMHTEKTQNHADLTYMYAFKFAKLSLTVRNIKNAQAMPLKCLPFSLHVYLIILIYFYEYGSLSIINNISWEFRSVARLLGSSWLATEIKIPVIWEETILLAVQRNPAPPPIGWKVKIFYCLKWEKHWIFQFYPSRAANSSNIEY